jgi:hypothetical protein
VAIIAIKVVSLNAVDGEVYLIQHYVKKLRQVGDFLRILRFLLSIQLTATIKRNEMSWKVALST